MSVVPATSMPSADTDDHDLLGRWQRERGFGSSPAGSSTSEWWIASVNHDGRLEAYSYKYSKSFVVPVTGTGHEIIDVLEIADGLARFRHYIVNPVGVRLSWSSAPRFETVNQVRAITLRKKLKRLKMLPWHEDAKPTEAPKPVAHTADIVAFPSSRIVRRIEHGAGVVVPLFGRRPA
jgi:hypothetical protein